jgi:5-methylcytosine-specific restriction enzyme A
MSLNAALTLFLEEYPHATAELFAGNPVAEFIRRVLPETIEAAISDNDRYLVRGSAGQGNWARVPWAAVFDRFVTDTAQDGYYVVYLVKEDFTGIYLSLNQGVTTIKKQYGTDAKKALRVRASDYLARIGTVADGLIRGPIELETHSQAGLGALYEQGAICSKYYQQGNIPDDTMLTADLRQFIDYYFSLVSRESALFDRSQQEEDEAEYEWEDLRFLRMHKRIERNKKLVSNVKTHLGLTCQVCTLNFEEVYGSIGKDYIEAHHLVPLSQLKGKRVALDPEQDFAVLCSNCHRMIHRSGYVSDVPSFRQQILNHQAS